MEGVICMCTLVSINTYNNESIKVAQNKAPYIKNIIDISGDYSYILKIILFGSSLTEDCSDDSDIDIMLVSDVPRSKLYKNKAYRDFLRRIHDKDDYSQQYDVICVYGAEVDREDDFYRNVRENGQLLYAKGKI